MKEIHQWKQEAGTPCGGYWVYTGKEKAEIVRENLQCIYGISATIRHYAKIDPSRSLPSSSIFDWKEQYQYKKESEKEKMRLQNYRAS